MITVSHLKKRDQYYNQGHSLLLQVREADSQIWDSASHECSVMYAYFFPTSLEELPETDAIGSSTPSSCSCSSSHSSGSEPVAVGAPPY